MYAKAFLLHDKVLRKNKHTQKKEMEKLENKLNEMGALNMK